MYNHLAYYASTKAAGPEELIPLLNEAQELFNKAKTASKPLTDLAFLNYEGKRAWGQLDIDLMFGVQYERLAKLDVINEDKWLKKS